jgi:hypothetical protein
MKKLLLIVTIIFSGFLFSSHVLAYDECSGVSPQVPCSKGGNDYYQAVGNYAPNANIHFFNIGTCNFYYYTVNECWPGLVSTWLLCSSFDAVQYYNGNWNYGSSGGDIYHNYGSPFNVTGYFELGIPSFTLTVTRSPEAGGEIEVNEIPCSSCPCQFQIALNAEAEANATPATGYAFAYWLEGEVQYTDNPHTFVMSEGREVEARFFKTFRNTVTEGFTYSISDVVGECVVYVRNETGIDYDAFNGNAEDCFGLAQEAGYATGTEPRIGAIAVFSSDAIPDVGHVGIVKVINSSTSIKLRHSNWSTYHAVSEEDINLTTTPVIGYIYPTP